MLYKNILFIYGLLLINTSIFSQGVFTQWHIPNTPSNSFKTVEYLDLSGNVMLVSSQHFYISNLSNISFTPKLTFKGEYSASFL